MPPHEKMSVDDFEQLSRLMAPAIAQALVPQFDKVREEMDETMRSHGVDAANRHALVQAELDKHNGRILALERFYWKAIGIVTGVSAVVIFILDHIWPRK